MHNHRYTPDMSGNVASNTKPQPVESNVVDVILERLLKQEDLWTFLTEKEQILIDRTELKTIGYLRGLDQPTTQLLVSLQFPERLTIFVESAAYCEKIYRLRGNQLTIVTVKPHFDHHVNIRVARISHGLSIPSNTLETVSREILNRLSTHLKQLYDR